MTDERDVRGWLATAEAPELRLDLRHTVEAGREKARRRRIRRIAGGGALVLAALLVVPGTVVLLNRDPTDAPPAAVERTPPPDGPFSCTYQALPVPSGLDAIDPSTWHLDLAAMDPSGRYVVGLAMTADVIAGPRVPVLWDNGVGRVISPELRAHPTAVSENGVIAGQRFPGGEAWVYRDGVVEDVPVPADATSVQISRVAANGDLLGTVTTHSTMKVAIWKAGDLAKPEILPASGEVVSPIQFLPDGGVLGWQSMEQRAYVWNAAREGTAYAPPAGAIDARPVGAGGGWVYGQAIKFVNSGLFPYRARLGGGAPEWFELPAVTPAAEELQLRAVGANGALLLEAVNDGRTDKPRFRAFVVRGEHMAQLPGPAGADVYVSIMNEFGTKLAGMTSSQEQPRGQHGIWTC